MTAVLKDGGEGEGGLAEQGLRAAGGDRLMTKLQSEANLFITIHTQTPTVNTICSANLLHITGTLF